MPFEDFSVEKLAGRTPPARLYLFTVDLNPPGASADDTLTIYARTVALPGLTNEEIEIPYMNSRFYIAGRRNWETFDVGFMENENGEIHQLFYDWCNRIYDVEGYGQGGVPKEYKARMDVTRLTVKGEEIDEYQVIGCWPTTLAGIDFDYTSDEIQLVTVTFRFDYWIRNALKASIKVPGLPGAGQLDVPGISTII